jgi:hypothetical protein
MKRLVLLAAAIGVGVLVVPSAAFAATGDVQRLEVDDPIVVFDDGDKLAVDGDVECAVEDNWGIIMKAIDDDEDILPHPNESGSDDFQEFGEDGPNFESEALGFGGPGSGNQGPVEQPCGEQGTPFDLVLEKLGSSGDFDDDDDIGVWALAAESPTQQADPAFLGDAEVFFGTFDVQQED